MSMPKLPEENSISREEAVNLILTSIGMEELGLSHILNAEGEKLQYALGTLEGATGSAESLKIEDLLSVNQSVRETLGLTIQNQMLLNTKLGNVKSMPTMHGPTGPTGATGPQGIQGQTGAQGPQGPQGLPGPAGVQGPPGIQGIPGENGFAGITVRGNYNPAEKYDVNDYVVSDQGNGFVARIQNPTNPPPEEFVSNNEWAAFVAAGAPGEQGTQGLEGPRGPDGQQGVQGIQGPPGPTGATGTQGPKGDTGATGAQGPKGDTGQQGAPVEAYNFNLSASGSAREVTVGNVVFRLAYAGGSSISLYIRPSASPVLIDYARSSFFTLLGGTVEFQPYNNYTLSTSLGVDTEIYSNSNELQKSWLRQQNPNGTWSLCEYSIFASRNGARVTLWINWIYKDLEITW